jgi:hypothetical protein
MQSRKRSSSTARLSRLVTAVLTAAALLALGGACAPERPASSAEIACIAPGGHCEYDGHCCSHRCYHDTGCAGGTP